MSSFPEYRWWKAGEVEKAWPETFLKSREEYCVSACARYLKMSFLFDRMWVLSSGGRNVAALLFQSGKMLFPIFGGEQSIQLPQHIKRAIQTSKIQGIQGLSADTEILEDALLQLGFSTGKRIDFNLMTLDSEADTPSFIGLPNGITLRMADKQDYAELLPLHEAYEREEVLPPGTIIHPKFYRIRLAALLEKEQMLAAVYNGRIIGKINTNARSFSRCQIGGVYVAPQYRNLGIGYAMTGVFSKILLAEGRGVSLFVKKNNHAAQAVYHKTGFKKAGDYRIVSVD
jgi:predicted GNAT family acetyltransferase